MTKLIGTNNNYNSLPLFKKILKQKYQGLEKVMLQLPQDWSNYKKTFAQHDYFYDIARNFEDQGKIIIPGDLNHYSQHPHHSEKKVNLEKKINFIQENLEYGTGDMLREFLKWYPQEIKELFSILGYSLIPGRNEQRKEGFIKAYDIFQPELIIVDDKFAKYLNTQDDFDYESIDAFLKKNHKRKIFLHSYSPVKE